MTRPAFDDREVVGFIGEPPAAPGPPAHQAAAAVCRRLAALPPLRQNPVNTELCKICGEPAAFFDVVDFNKHCDDDYYSFGISGVPVPYFRCGACGFVFTTAFDSWGTEEFTRFIYNEDYYALVDREYKQTRPLRVAAALAPALKHLAGAAILDYGSGSGRFAEDMRRRGFSQIAEYDPFSAPERPQSKFELITCIEVIEHSTDPVATLRDMAELLAEGGGIIATQLFQPPDIGAIRANWWFIGPRNGHVSFFTEQTFAAMAERAGLVLHAGSTTHGFTRRTPSPAIAALMAAIKSSAAANVSVIRLLAPTGEAPAWHEIEAAADGTAFRWTGSPSIEFAAPNLPAGPIEVRMPFVMEARPGFAAACRVAIGETEWPMAAVDGRIVARVDWPAGGAQRVRLLTPEPVPAGPQSARKVGLAVPLGQR
jgi:Methyltransferase domain